MKPLRNILNIRNANNNFKKWILKKKEDKIIFMNYIVYWSTYANLCFIVRQFLYIRIYLFTNLCSVYIILDRQR